MMAPLQLVDTYARIARQVMRKYMAPNSCIGAAWLTIECLKRLGIPAVPVPVKAVVRVRSINKAFVYGASEEEMATAGRVVRSREQGWRGHLVVVTQSPKFFLDPTIEAALDALGLPQDPDGPIFTVPLPDEAEPVELHLECHGVLDDGTKVEFEYFSTDDHSYQQTEAWNDESLPLIAAEILTRIKKEPICA
jgi:hypothetical protein